MMVVRLQPTCALLLLLAMSCSSTVLLSDSGEGGMDSGAEVAQSDAPRIEELAPGLDVLDVQNELPIVSVDVPALPDVPARIDAECFTVTPIDTPQCQGFSASACMGGSFCPATIAPADLNHPQFVLTQIDFTAPRSIGRTSPVNALLNNAAGRGFFLWGLDVDPSGLLLRTGPLHAPARLRVGTGFFSETLTFYRDDAPTTVGTADGGTMMLAANRWNTARISLTNALDGWSTAMDAALRIPVFNETSGGLLVELPMRNTRFVRVRANATQTCIATTRRSEFNSCLGQQWQTTDPAGMPLGGEITGVFLVDEARNSTVTALNTSLCNLLAGRNCDSIPMDQWSNPPDTMIDGRPGWNFRATIAAVAVHIGF